MTAMAINHMTMPTFSTLAVLDMAKALGCVGVELRNDLAAGLFDGQSPKAIRAAAERQGLRLLALAEVYAFNDNTPDTRQQARDLAKLAVASGAEAIVLIPRVAPAPVPRDVQRCFLRDALDALMPILNQHGVIGLIEPLGFANSSLRLKEDAVAVLDDMGRPDCFALIHDTFHHALAEETAVFADLTKIVHISGITDPLVAPTDMRDAHRVLVDDQDRLGNVHQIKQLKDAGYKGPLSFEAFAPAVHALPNPADALLASTTFIASQVA